MTNVTRKVARETLVDKWGLPYGDDGEIDVEILETLDHDHGRWESYHEVIFVAPDDGKTYSAHYSRGLTEYQEHKPWEDENEVSLTQVEPVECVITVTEWKTVSEPTEIPVPTLPELKARWAAQRDWDESGWSEEVEW